MFVDKIEVIKFDIKLHVVPEVDGDAAVGLCEVVEPEAGEEQHVPCFQLQLELGGVCIFWIAFKIRTSGVDSDPRHQARVYLLHFKLPCLCIFLINSRFKVSVRNPWKICGGLKHQLFSAAHNAVNVFVWVLMH